VISNQNPLVKKVILNQNRASKKITNQNPMTKDFENPKITNPL